MTKKMDDRHSKYAARLLKCCSLEDVLLELKLPEWDYLIVGDGSGTNWSAESGWGSVLIDGKTGERKSFWGAFSAGTSNTAEMMAVIHPLLWIAATQATKKPKGIAVQVVTDSQLVAQSINGVQARKANAELWILFDSFKRKGISVKANWIPRDCIALNHFADGLAGRSRKALELLDEQALAHDFKPHKMASVYALNPSEEKK